MDFEKLKEKALEVWAEIEKPSKPVLRIGAATCGRAAGALSTKEAIENKLKELKIEAKVMLVGCLGCCYAEPLIDIKKPGMPRIVYKHATPEKAKEIIESYLLGDDPKAEYALGTIGEGSIASIPELFSIDFYKKQVRLVTENCGNIEPTNIMHYIANKGFEGLKKALSMKPEEVIEEVKKSGLRGRGGAGFPTGLKWEFCRKAAGDVKYLICNADEGDPGAFMNRTVLESDPYRVLEGMLIAGYAIGATEGYIYIRAEYPLAVETLRIAIKEMEKYGFAGENILDSDFSFKFHMFLGAGAFVCGEETALIASIEGKAGRPRAKPPYPAQKGLFGKPTNINNVETLANLPWILRNGAEAFASYGTEKSKGTKTFCITGKVKRTGLVEVPLGITLREIIEELGGGTKSGAKFKAVQTGGPSGGVIPYYLADTPVDYESLAELGSIMGSGGMIVMDENTCMVETAKYFVNFTRNESCGKCSICREGTKQMHRILEKITEGKAKLADLELLEELGNVMKDSALCGLGMTAPNPVLTTLKYFRKEYEMHIKEHKCAAKQCKTLIKYRIIEEKCVGCGSCARACPVQAITGIPGKPHKINEKLCVKCGACKKACKFNAIVVE